MVAFMLLSLTGCVDEIYPGSEKPNNKLEDAEALVFDINLSPLGDNTSTAGILDHGEDWENYIDPSKFRVLFFDLQGNYIFEADRRYMTVVSKDNKWTGSTTAYRVTIPQKDLHQSKPGDAPTEVIQDVIMNKGFKVAVLANWPTFVEGLPEYDPETQDPVLTSQRMDTNLDFEYDASHVKDNSKLEYLSHCIYDNVYGAVENGVLKYSAYKHLVDYKDTYNYGGRMGVYSSWVSYLYKSQKDAAKFIREGKDYDGDDLEGDVKFTYSCSGSGDSFTYTPYSYTRTLDQYNVYKLENIWRLWNFSAGTSCPYHIDNGDYKNTNNITVNEYWKARNENALIYQLEKSGEYNPNDGSYSFPNGFDVVSISTKNTQGVKFIPAVPGDNHSGYIEFPHAIDNDIVMKDVAASLGDKTNRGYMDTFEANSLTFPAYGEGTLRIRCKAVDDNPNTRLVVVTKIPGSANSEKIAYFSFRDASGVSKTSDEYRFYPAETTDRHKKILQDDPYLRGSEYEQSVEYIINPNSQQYLEVYLGAVGGSLDIYEIEYMRARHIYDSARNCIMPSASNPIPMYGLQVFDPIGDYIRPNCTFNMSDEAENDYLSAFPELAHYNYRNIFLLRSLAKVELRFNRSVFKNNPPEHVMMRVMNRTARCEPKDVINPTEWIWYGYNPVASDFPEAKEMPDTWSGILQSMQGKFPGAVQEFRNICDYGPLFQSGSGTFAEYRNRTSWYFGVWVDQDDSLDPAIENQFYWQTAWDWGIDNKGLGNSDMTRVEIPAGSPVSPRIFNTRIHRSDYCRFHKMADSDPNYIRYVMYIPEKNIDDTDDIGDLTKRPKVQHIELRFAGMNDVMNFDDNDHYRIYFTNYTLNGSRLKTVDRDGNSNFDQWEQKRENLQLLQPIMRNCHYIFTINSINNEQLGVNFSVCGAATRNGQVVTFK